MAVAKTAVITGASSGIGRALALRLADEGWAVFACARRLEPMSEAFKDRPEIKYRSCDVANEGQVFEFADWVRSKSPGLSVLVNAAGSFGAIGEMVNTESADWTGTMAVNLFGTYYAIKAFIQLLKASGSGRIINFSGGGAFDPFPNYSAYAVSKAAVVRLTENLAVELKDSDITVNAIAPGFVATEIHDATMAAGPDKAGNGHYHMTEEKIKQGGIPIKVPVDCIMYLLSPEAAKLTGKTISAGFDPWTEPEFSGCIDDINQSDLYAMRRINLINLGESKMVRSLNDASDRKHK